MEIVVDLSVGSTPKLLEWMRTLGAMYNSVLEHNIFSVSILHPHITSIVRSMDIHMVIWISTWTRSIAASLAGFVVHAVAMWHRRPRRIRRICAGNRHRRIVGIIGVVETQAEFTTDHWCSGRGTSRNALRPCPTDKRGRICPASCCNSHRSVTAGYRNSYRSRCCVGISCPWSTGDGSIPARQCYSPQGDGGVQTVLLAVEAVARAFDTRNQFGVRVS